MAASTIAQADHLIKRIFPEKRTQRLTLQDNVFLDRCMKDESHEGSVAEIPMLYAGGQGHGTTLSVAQTNQSNTKGQKALYDTGTYITVSRINHKTMKAMRSDRGSFARARDIEFSEALKMHGNDLSVQAWGDGGAALGQVATSGGVSGTTIKLEDPADIVKFEVDMQIVASDDSGAGGSDALLDTGDINTISSVNYEAGTFVVASQNIAGLGASDYLFRSGMFAGEISQADIMKGLQAHCTTATPTTSLHNVDRTLHSRLYGMIPPSSVIVGNYEKRFKAAASWYYSRFGSTPRDYYIHPDHWAPLTEQLEHIGVREISAKNDTGTFGYEAIEFRSPYGKCRILTDRHCPKGRCYSIDHNHVKILSMGPLTSLVDEDGQTILREADTMDFQVRYASYGEVCINKPCAHGSFALPSLS